MDDYTYESYVCDFIEDKHELVVERYLDSLDFYPSDFEPEDDDLFEYARDHMEDEILDYIEKSN